MTGTVMDNLTAAQEALAADPTNAALHTELGMAYFHLGQYHEALAAFRQALNHNPQEAAAHNGVGRVHYHIGPPEAAIAAYTRAIELDPRYVEPYWGLGILYFAKLGDYAQALATFRRGLANIPEETAFHEGIGHAYARQGSFDEAIAAYEEATRLDPGSPGGYANLGIIYLHLRRYEDAAGALTRAIALDPADHSPHRVLGFVHDRMGRPDQAAAELEQAVGLDPGDYEARGALARAYRALGRAREAAEQLAAGRELAARDDEYGRACFEAVSGNSEAALALLEVALAQSSSHPAGRVSTRSLCSSRMSHATGRCCATKGCHIRVRGGMFAAPHFVSPPCPVCAIISHNTRPTLRRPCNHTVRHTWSYTTRSIIIIACSTMSRRG